MYDGLEVMLRLIDSTVKMLKVQISAITYTHLDHMMKTSSCPKILACDTRHVVGVAGDKTS